MICHISYTNTLNWTIILTKCNNYNVIKTVKILLVSNKLRHKESLWCVTCTTHFENYAL